MKRRMFLADAGAALEQSLARDFSEELLITEIGLRHIEKDSAARA
jgi:hypothetical protein